MDEMQQFFTREKANNGIKLPLYTPTGEKTDHWLLIRGVDSDTYQACQRSLLSEQANIKADLQIIEDKQERKKIAAQKLEDQENTLIASLVVDWSFKTQCNEKNIKKLLVEAPQIKQAINTISTKRSLFFNSGPSNSKNLQK